MGVYIKNITKERAERCLQFAMSGWCIEEMPEIIELPPHGRLIDAEALAKDYDGFPVRIDPWVWNELSHAPTIIPADVPDNNVGNIPAEEGEE